MTLLLSLELLWLLLLTLAVTLGGDDEQFSYPIRARRSRSLERATGGSTMVYDAATDTYTLASGRQFRASWGVIGIGPSEAGYEWDADSRTFRRRDRPVIYVGGEHELSMRSETTDTPLSSIERVELAAEMIDRWRRFAEEA